MSADTPVKMNVIVVSTPDSKDEKVLGKLREMCMVDVVTVNSAFERGIAIHSMIDIESGANFDINPMIIDEAWVVESEKHDFKCQANHRDKGHVKPFYRRGRW